MAGELYVGGAQVARGYLNHTDLTAERFILDPFVKQITSRMYRSGDRARFLPNGAIEFLGRVDQQIKLRGYRIEPDEISAVLMEHPEVQQAVVSVHEGREKVLVAYAVLRDRATTNSEELWQYLSEKLPSHMVPARVVKLEALPRTPHGKLDRQALPAPGRDAYARGGYEAPIGAAEEALALIWAELLGVERVGRRDNFFEIGGHSILAVKLVSTLKQRNIDISLAKLFAYPTIEMLASEVAVHGEAILEQGALPLRTTGNQTPLFLLPESSGEMLYGSYLTRHLTGDFPVYGLQLYPSRETPMRTVEAMAAKLRQVIRAIQPVGPYRVAGWSFGGKLAYEIARQLVGEDETVEFVGLIDIFIQSGQMPDILRTQMRQWILTT